MQTLQTIGICFRDPVRLHVGLAITQPLTAGASKLLEQANLCNPGDQQLLHDGPIFGNTHLFVRIVRCGSDGKNRFSKLVSNWSFPSTPLSPATTDWVDCSPAMGGSKPRFLQFWISNFCCHQSDRLLMTLVCSWHWNHKHLEIPFLSQNGLGRYHSTTRNKML